MCRRLFAFALVLALMLGMTACKEKTTSENVTDAVQDAGEAVGDAAEATGEAVGDAAEATGEAVKDAPRA